MREVADSRLSNGKTAFLLIALLFSLAVTQPLFNLLGEHAEFFVTHGMGRSALLVFAATLAILLPLVAAAVPVAFGALSVRLGKITFRLLQCLLWLLIFLPAASRLGLEGIGAIAVSTAAAVICMAAYAAYYPVRLTLYYLTPAIAVFPLAFLFASKATEIVLPRAAAHVSSPQMSAIDTDVVFIVLDEFPLVSLLTPDLNIDRARYPNFGRLADASTWFRGATTPSEITTGSVPVALSGLEFQEIHGSLPIHANVPRNLFTLLAASHEINVLETSTLLCPETVCEKEQTVDDKRDFIAGLSADLLIIYAHLVVPRPFSEQLPSISHAWAGFGLQAKAPDAALPSRSATDPAQLATQIRQQERWGSRAEDFREFVRGIRNFPGPQLYYLHSLLPHSQWVYLPDGKTYIFSSERVNFGIRPDDDPQRVYFHEWYGDSHAVNQAWQRHLLQVQFVDRLIGQLLDRLVTEEMFNDTLIVVVADHGASFVPGRSRRSADEKSLSDIAAVPLFIKFPGSAAGRVEDAPATLADILPTMVAAMDLETDWTFHGSDLRNIETLEDRKSVTIHQSDGAPVRYPVNQHWAHLRQRAGDLNRVFGSGQNSRLFNFGPFPELAGRAVETLSSGPPAEGKVVLEGPELFLDVDSDAAFLPLQIWGRWSGMPQERLPRQLAIAVDGIIRSTTQTYEIPGYHDFFSAVLPPEAISDGFNQVEIFSVHGAPGAPVLRALMRADRAPMRLVSSERGEILILEDGSEYVVQSGIQPGNVETVMDRSGTLAYLQGSVAAEPGEELTLVVVRNGLSVEQLQITAVQGPDTSDSTSSRFQLPIVYLDEASANATELRVLALSRSKGIVGELRYPPLCSPRWIYAPPPSWELDNCNKVQAELPKFGGGEYRVVLKFGQESIRQYMGEGWRVKPNAPSWTIGNRAELRLPLPEFDGEWRFRATIKPFLAPGKLEQQRVTLSVHGRIVGNWALDSRDFTTLEWNIPGNLAAGESGLLLEFSLPDASSPHELGAGVDQGQLGVAWLSLVISNRPIGEP
jgi:hypothetical protein